MRSFHTCPNRLVNMVSDFGGYDSFRVINYLHREVPNDDTRSKAGHASDPQKRA